MPISKRTQQCMENYGWTIDSEFETVSAIESDRESDYMTGLEDIPDGLVRKLKEESISKRVLLNVDELCHTSSFIQNILYEDSRAGVAVVDLFVAVKTAKDDLDFLSKCNSELFYKINDLNEKTEVISTEYRNLLEMINKFFDRMNGDALFWNYQLLKPKSSSSIFLTEDNLMLPEEKFLKDNKEPNLKEIENSREEQNLKSVSKKFEPETVAICSEEVCDDCISTKNVSLEESSRRVGDRCQKCEKKESEKRVCSKCGKDLKNKKSDFMTILKDKSFNQLPILSEALLGSFLASFLWLLRGQEAPVNPSKSSSPTSQTPEEEKENETENLCLKESTIQMICDICEILNETAFQEMDLKELPHFSLKRPQQPEEDLDLSNLMTHGTSLRDRCKTPTVKITVSSERVDLKRFPLKEVSTMSGGTADRLRFGKETVESLKSDKSSKKMIVLEANDDSISEGDSEFEEALSCPFTPLPQRDVKAKPSVTCMGDLTKAVNGKKSVSTLTPTTNIVSSCVERISEEIRSKIKKRKSKTNVKVIEQPFEKSEKTLMKSSGALQFTITANTPGGIFDINVVQYKKRRFSGNTWSEDSFRYSDVESIKAESNSGEDELEEFLEIFVMNSKPKKKEEQDVLRTMDLKTAKTHFFEIQKCYPSYFSQTIFLKTPKSKHDEWGELGKCRNIVTEKEVMSCNLDEKQKKVVIEGGSSDLVIYIQVEVEDGLSHSSNGVFMDYVTSSLGTQTLEDGVEPNVISNERIIRLSENEQDGESLFHIWKDCESSNSGKMDEERITFDESFSALDESENKVKKEQLEKQSSEEKVVMVKDLKEKTVTFNEKLSKFYAEKEIQESYFEKVKIMGIAHVVVNREEKHRADVWFSQNKLMQRIDIVLLQPVPGSAPEIVETINVNPVELAKALNLIHEIENDIVDIKLDDAISILPQLESELRKHLQSKIKSMGERESEVETSVDNFFSAVDFWPDEESAEDDENYRSQERLNNLLKLLSDLEEAVKFNEYCSRKVDVCEFSSSKIYKLLHALTLSIRELEDHPNVTSLSQTLDIASQLDTAVREYDSIVKRKPLDYVVPEKKMKRKSKSLEELPVKHHLKNVRKKVFEIVEEEAYNLEGRIERDFDRLDRIERQNDEAMMFLEAFLQKTERRMLELSNLKTERKELSTSLNNMCIKCQETIMRRKEKDKEREIEVESQNVRRKESKEKSVPANPPRESSPAVKEEPVRETVSGLLIALDSLKSRAREKNEVCKEILYSSDLEKVQELENSSRRSSRSSFTAKHAEKLTSSVKEYKKIGDTSLYLAWSEPEGVLKDSIVGYQIYVNGKLNQKVRNPQRLQAVLYSIDFTKKTQVQLYALAENNPKILLATVGY